MATVWSLDPIELTFLAIFLLAPAISPLFSGRRYKRPVPLHSAVLVAVVKVAIAAGTIALLLPPFSDWLIAAIGGIIFILCLLAFSGGLAIIVFAGFWYSGFWSTGSPPERRGWFMAPS